VTNIRLANTGESLAILCDDTVIDSLTYATRHAPRGISVQKDARFLTGSNANLDAHWCVTPQTPEFAYVDGKFGTPGRANVSCP
jgi:hypothetical protein